MSRFLARYVDYFQKRTDAPIEFGEATGLMALSTLALGRRWLSSGDNLNIFMLLVGPSSRDRKTTAIDIVMDLIEETEPKRIGPGEFSPEGLLFHMRKKRGLPSRNRLIISMPEFGNALALMQRQYAQGTGALFCQLYDGSTIVKAKSGKRPITVVRPQVSLLGGAAYAMLEKYTAPVDWEGGFFARMLFIAGETRPQLYDDKPNMPTGERDITRMALVDLQQELEGNQKSMSLSDEAREVFKQWRKSLPMLNSDANPNNIAALANIERLVNTTIKVAALYQIDLSPSLVIGVPAMEKALKFAELARRGYSKVRLSALSTQKARMMNRIWESVSKEKTVSQREVYRSMHIPIEEAQPLIELLCKLGCITQISQGKKKLLQVVEEYVDPTE